MKTTYIIIIIIACASMPLLPSHAQQVIVKDGYTVISADGYSQGTQIDNDFVDALLGSLKATETVKRKKRHVRSENKYISPLFAIAPNDINDTGVHVDAHTPMTWAEAAGWGDNANTVAPGEAQFALNRGCPAYKGRESKDAIGTWRLPTYKELHLMNLLKRAMDKTSANTGFKPYFENKVYWTSTEEKDNAGSACVQTVSGSPNSGTKKKTEQLSARCVKDLPVTP